MQAELAHIRQPITRWQFVSGCVRVALFPPDPQGSRMNAWLKHWLMAFGSAALFGLLAVGPFAFMEVTTTPGFGRGSSHSRTRSFTPSFRIRVRRTNSDTRQSVSPTSLLTAHVYTTREAEAANAADDR
jgi:hypothetical protein